MAVTVVVSGRSGRDAAVVLASAREAGFHALRDGEDVHVVMAASAGEVEAGVRALLDCRPDLVGRVWLEAVS
jgi:hypothetical protein